MAQFGKNCQETMFYIEDLNNFALNPNMFILIKNLNLKHVVGVKFVLVFSLSENNGGSHKIANISGNVQLRRMASCIPYMTHWVS